MADSNVVNVNDDIGDFKIHTGIDILSISKQIMGDVPKIPEHVFVARILPLFTRAPSEDNPIELGLWMEYANSMQAPLDVVGPNGEVLFRAPSPLKSVIQLHRRSADGNPSLLEIVTRAKLKSDVHPRLGENYLNNELMELDIIRDIDGEESINDWKAILERYDLLPKTTTAVVPTETPDSNNGDITFLDDDDPL